MKFTLAVAAALASLASAEKLNLRKGTAPKGPKVKETFDAQVKIAGLVHEPTEMEMAVVDAAVVETYNEAYESVGHKLTKANSKSAMLVGEEDGADSVALLAGQVYFTDNSGYYCRWCDDDYDDWWAYVTKNGWAATEPPAVMAVQIRDMHVDFEQKLCEKIQSSGLANFANAKDCSFSLLEKPGAITSRVPVENAYDSLNGQTTKSQVSMIGLLRAPSEDEFKLIETTIVETHNDAFSHTGYTLGAFDAVSSLAVGTKWWVPDCDKCNMDDAVTLIFSNVSPLSDEDDSRVGKMKDLAYTHESFEKAACSKLANSGLANFANVHDCKFRFVYNAAGEAVDEENFADEAADESLAKA